MTSDTIVRRKGRSPNYPSIDLPTALQLARSVLDTFQMHQVPVDAIVSCWGYKSQRSGIAATKYASLKKFGLLIEESAGGARQARVSDLARSILQNPDEDKRLADIRRAALMPPLHKEFWEKYGAAMPPEPTLHYTLTTDLGFTESGAGEFIKQFMATIDFTFGRADDAPVGLANQDTRVPLAASEQRPVAHGTRSTESASTRIPIPLVGGYQVVVEGPFPISTDAWDNLVSVLNALKPGLTSETSEDFVPAGHSSGMA